MIGHLLTRTLEIYRRVDVDDGQGGTTTSWQLQGAANFKVDQPSPAELVVAEQAQSRHSHDIYALPSEDIRRGDELRDPPAVGTDAFRLQSVVEPSTAIYRKALAELIQQEP